MGPSTLVLALCGIIGAIFLVVLTVFILFVLYYYKKRARLLDEEEIYDKAGSGTSSRSGSIVRSNNVHMERAHSFKDTDSESSAIDNDERVEVISQEMWKHTKGDIEAVTYNPAFNQDDKLFDNFGFDKENSEDEDLDSGLADVSTVEDESKEGSNFENAANEDDGVSKTLNNQSDQIQILNMTTWSQPPSSPNMRMPFTISSKVSRGERNKEEYTVDFTKANPLTQSLTKLNRNRLSAGSIQRSHSQTVVDFYESANSKQIRSISSDDLPADGYDTGRRLLWQKKKFNSN